MSKLREFWITINRCALPDTVSFTQNEMFNKVAPNDDYYHVIEYSSYEAEKQKAERLIEIIEIYREGLAAFNKLKFYANKGPEHHCSKLIINRDELDNYSYRLDEALTKTDELLKEIK